MRQFLTAKIIIGLLLLSLISGCVGGITQQRILGPEPGCVKGLIVDLQIMLMVPNIGPLSVGLMGSGVQLEFETPGFQAQLVARPPSDFEGFTCLTVIVKNNGWEGNEQAFDVYFNENMEFHISVFSEKTTEYVFNAGRMVVSPGGDKPAYMNYDYEKSLLTIDASQGRITNMEIEVSKQDADKSPWFCSEYLENNNDGFLNLSDLFVAWYFDFTNKMRQDFLSMGSTDATILFWFSFILIISISLAIGFLLKKRLNMISSMLFWILVPLSVTIFYMRVLFYQPGCPIFW